LEKWASTLTARSEGGRPNVKQAARELVETQRELSKKLKAFSAKEMRRHHEGDPMQCVIKRGLTMLTTIV